MPMPPRIDDLTSDRLRRLFACACCRSIWPLLMDERSRRAVEVAERFADGSATEEERAAASAAAREVVVGQVEQPPPAPPRPPGRPSPLDPDALRLHSGQAMNPAAGAAHDTTRAAMDEVAAAELALAAVSDWGAAAEAEEAELRKQEQFLGDLVRPPGGAVAPSPFLLDWNGRTIPRLAEAIYEERRMPEGTLDLARLSILADALLDAGCDDEALIQHCRSAGPHVRGCWAVDLLLGRR